MNLVVQEDVVALETWHDTHTDMALKTHQGSLVMLDFAVGAHLAVGIGPPPTGQLVGIQCWKVSLKQAGRRFQSTCVEGLRIANVSFMQSMNDGQVEMMCLVGIASLEIEVLLNHFCI